MNEIAMFESALRVAVPTQPDPALGRDLVPRLAQAARTSTLEAETRAARRRPRSRIALVAKVGIAVALIPLVLAGLAFAGVTVPSAARSAFDSIGITLPNQPSHRHASSGAGQSTTTSGNDVSGAARSPAHRAKGGNSAAAHRHALAQRARTHGRALGHQHGRAVGLTGSTPPGHSGDTASPSNSSGGSSGGGSSSSHRSNPVHPIRPFHPTQPTHPAGPAGAHGNGH